MARRRSMLRAALVCLPILWVNAATPLFASPEAALSERDEKLTRELVQLLYPAISFSEIILDAYTAEMSVSPPILTLEFYEEIEYRAAIESGNCKHAEDMLIDSYVAEYPNFALLLEDSSLLHIWRTAIAEPNYPEALVCSLAQEIRLIEAMREAVHLPPRPFTDDTAYIQGIRNNFYVERDRRIVSLIYLSEDYAPAGVAVARFAMEGVLVQFPDILTYMLLLRMRDTWPDLDVEIHDATQQQLNGLLEEVSAKLDDETRARAVNLYMTDVLYNTLKFGQDFLAENPENNLSE
ncbi:MAG: hypothetical protein AAFX39_04800 [Pseudomonadota bacterium]